MGPRAALRLLLRLTLCGAAIAIAPVASADGATPRRVVAVKIDGASEDARPLEATIRELLARLQLNVTTPDKVPPASLLESVTIDLTGTYGARVVVRSANGTTVLDRTVPRGDSPAIQREQIAHAVRGAAEAELLIDDDRVAGRAPPVIEPLPAFEPRPASATEDAMRVEAPPANADTPPTPLLPRPARARVARALALDVSTFAGGGLFAPDASVVARVGGAAALWLRKDGVRPGVSVLALYAFPFETGDDVVSARTNVLSLRVLPSVALVHNARFSLEVEAGGGLDVVSVDPTSAELPSSALGAATTRASGVFSGAVTGRLGLASDVALTLTAMLDVDPTSRRWVFDDRGLSRDVLAPWTARPMLLAGLSFTAMGPAR
ncbi:MAG: hypothetical protein KIT84_04515 [Labilithrix sp.]|nr:hypothetical protein [Labilithrix sp.]MCW5810249.1 hypothetical protein [Labilithrix sp.]